MLHEQLREARIRAGLTQVKLAKLANVPRSQLRKFEEGGNITLTTLRKLVTQLPDLQRLNLGAVEILPGNVDPVAIRSAAADMIALGHRLLAAVGGPAEPDDETPLP
ncbi:MAG TPA: helix-turn-helix transcriptional regulator [Thermoanaerobaculia bacterium]|nr:helix-turn-helix transcriptional regulator [Thermoanaerobaculia bacterium]